MSELEKLRTQLDSWGQSSAELEEPRLDLLEAGWGRRCAGARVRGCAGGFRGYAELRTFPVEFCDRLGTKQEATQAAHLFFGLLGFGTSQLPLLFPP